MIKRLLTQIYSMFIWSGVIRAILELFYPTMLAALCAIAKDWRQKGKLIVPLAEAGFLLGFLCFTALHIEHHKF
jgi:hypothetical protein